MLHGAFDWRGEAWFPQWVQNDECENHSAEPHSAHTLGFEWRVTPDFFCNSPAVHRQNVQLDVKWSSRTFKPAHELQPDQQRQTNRLFGSRLWNLIMSHIETVTDIWAVSRNTSCEKVCVVSWSEIEIGRCGGRQTSSVFLVQDRHSPLTLFSACYSGTQLSSVCWCWGSHPPVCFSHPIVHWFCANIQSRNKWVHFPIVSYFYLFQTLVVNAWGWVLEPFAACGSFGSEWETVVIITFCSLVDSPTSAEKHNLQSEPSHFPFISALTFSLHFSFRLNAQFCC